jgi:hypothetical protein
MGTGEKVYNSLWPDRFSDHLPCKAQRSFMLHLILQHLCKLRYTGHIAYLNFVKIGKRLCACENYVS